MQQPSNRVVENPQDLDFLDTSSVTSEDLDVDLEVMFGGQMPPDSMKILSIFKDYHQSIRKAYNTCLTWIALYNEATPDDMKFRPGLIEDLSAVLCSELNRYSHRHDDLISEVFTEPNLSHMIKDNREKLAAQIIELDDEFKKMAMSIANAEELKAQLEVCICAKKKAAESWWMGLVVRHLD